MAGDPLPWDLQERVALIPDDIWEAGPEAVAEEIKRIQTEFLAKALPQVGGVRFDPEQGLFDKVVVEPAQPALLSATLDQVSAALEDALDDPANGLLERSREARVLRRMLERYGNDPQRIEMDCTSVYRSLTRQMVEDERGFQELPASEDNLALKDAAHAAAQGIRAAHPDIAENRRVLTEQALREMDDAGRAALKDARPILEVISTEALGQEFGEDILYLTEEMLAGPPREFESADRNPVLAGYDETVRTGSRVAAILTLLKKTPDLIHNLHGSAAHKLAELGINAAQVIAALSAVIWAIIAML